MGRAFAVYSAFLLLACAVAVPRLERDSAGGIQAQQERLADAEQKAAEERLASQEQFIVKEADLEKDIADLKADTHARAEERRSCAARVSTCNDTDTKLTLALDQTIDQSKVRESRTKYCSETGKGVDQITENAEKTLNTIMSILKSELVKANADGVSGEFILNNAGYQQPPASLLSNLIDMGKNLGELLKTHRQTNTADIVAITKQLECSACESSNTKLQGLRAKAKTDLENVVSQCEIMQEKHRVLDESAHERLTGLKRALDQLAASKAMRAQMEEETAKQRKAAQELTDQLKKQLA